MLFIDRRLSLKKSELFALLVRLCADIEPTITQNEKAKTAYHAVGDWLAGSDIHLLQSSNIYLQGSTALGTTVKPIGKLEHDVDLICHMAHGGDQFQPAVCKKVVGDRLKQHGLYASMLEEKRRCWRLNYAGDFHLDITSSVPNEGCRQGGELVPDKELRCWKPTNPKGYRAAFLRRAALLPNIAVSAFEGLTEDRARADIEPFPDRVAHRSVLCRAVQIAKRHRDVFFQAETEGLAPLSVIITTLAAWSYVSVAAMTSGG